MVFSVLVTGEKNGTTTSIQTTFFDTHLYMLLFSLCVCMYIVLLGVLDQKVGERTFQANMERRVALLLGEAMGLVRRVKRDTTIGNNSVQVFCLCIDTFHTG